MHRDADELAAGLGPVLQSPADNGRLELIVCRPAAHEREILAVGTIDAESGLAGDTWRSRGSGRTADGSAHPDKQVTVMNSRAAALVAGPHARWALAGDQLYVDLDLSTANLPPGTWLAIGGAVIEITNAPHRGCAKFAARFGPAAVKLVNSPAGVAHNLRGVNARVIQPGRICTGDRVRKVEPEPDALPAGVIAGRDAALRSTS